MEVKCLPLGDYQTNCYLAWAEDADTCIVIDPGYAPEQVLSEVKKHGKKIEAVLLTHGHFDHVGAVKALVEATDCQLWMHEGDWSQFPNPANAYFFPLANCDFTEVNFCTEGQEISAAGLKLLVLSTPGHTRGSVCYLCDGTLISGDTLFQGSCGRTDLPGGNGAQIFQSLQRLAALPGDLRVLPGHGDETTLDAERKHNPYLR